MRTVAATIGVALWIGAALTIGLLLELFRRANYRPWELPVADMTFSGALVNATVHPGGKYLLVQYTTGKDYGRFVTVTEQTKVTAQGATADISDAIYFLMNNEQIGVSGEISEAGVTASVDFHLG